MSNFLCCPQEIQEWLFCCFFSERLINTDCCNDFQCTHLWHKFPWNSFQNTDWSVGERWLHCACISILDKHSYRNCNDSMTKYMQRPKRFVFVKWHTNWFISRGFIITEKFPTPWFHFQAYLLDWKSSLSESEFKSDCMILSTTWLWTVIVMWILCMLNRP